jgi:large subunit ribosomal protein L22
MEAKAQVKFIRMSPRKTRLVVDLIRGLDIEGAVHQLRFMPKAAAGPVLKLLNSATANAVNNLKLQRDNLYIKTVTVDGGPVLKRWQPRAFGRATPIRKRSAHITIVLAEKVVSKKQAEKEKVGLEKPQVVDALKTFTKEKAKEAAKEEEKKPAKFEAAPRGRGQPRGFLKKFFSRKTG